MITDGRHARVDGLTSLAVIPAVIGSWLNIPILDPIFALIIGTTIVFITWDAIVAMYYRLMDAVDPHLVEHAEAAIRRNTQVLEINYLRMRWVGHCLYLETCLVIEDIADLSTLRSLKQQIETELQKELPHLAEVTLSVTQPD